MATKNAINSNIPIEVSLGGLGAITHTVQGVLLGQGTGAVTTATGNDNGRPLIGSTGTNPALAAVTFGAAPQLTGTTGQNSLNLDIMSFVAQTAWTPVLTFGGGSTGLTYTTQTGTYMRFGRHIIYQMEIVLSAKGSSTGTAVISGLPVTSLTGSSLTCAGVQFSNLTFTGQVHAAVSSNSTTIALSRNPSGGAAVNLTDTAFSNTTTLRLTGFYITA
jgi:hypothetical protein